MNVRWQIFKLVFYALCFIAIAYCSYRFYTDQYEHTFEILGVVLLLLFIDIFIQLIRKHL